MKAINKYTNKEIELTGIISANGKNYLTVKGFKKGEYLAFDSVITLEGTEVTIEMFKKTSSEPTIIEIIMTINNLSKYIYSGDILSKDAQDLICEISISGNDFQKNVANSVLKYGKCSEKQASILANFYNK